METAIRAIVTGRVQGVGYRAWCATRARSLGLSGWVRNRRDGSVEAVIAGADAAVEAMLAALAEGPAHARVASVETAPAEAPAAGFEIRPDA